MLREVHLSCTKRSRKLARLKRALPDLRLSRQCDPNNIPPNTICYEYPLGREAELEVLAVAEGLTFQWGAGGGGFTCSTAVGDFLYACSSDDKLYIWDITNPKAPTRSGYTQLALGATGRDICVFRGTCYVLTMDAVLTINVEDPTVPTLTSTDNSQSGHNWSRMKVVGDTIFVAGDVIGHIGTSIDADSDEATDEFVVEGDPPDVVAAIAIQGRRIYEVADSAGFLRSYRIGGFYCPFIATGSMNADEISAEVLTSRHIIAKGEIVAASVSILGSALVETDTGVGTFSNYIKIGSRFILGSETIPDPNTLVKSTLGSWFFASDGTTWRNTDDDTAWSAF